MVTSPLLAAVTACRDEQLGTFFPGRVEPGTVAAAKAICAGCTVREECPGYALSLSEDPEGIWGATLGRERRRVRSGRLRLAS